MRNKKSRILGLLSKRIQTRSFRDSYSCIKQLLKTRLQSLKNVVQRFTEQSTYCYSHDKKKKVQEKEPINPAKKNTIESTFGSLVIVSPPFSGDTKRRIQTYFSWVPFKKSYLPSSLPIFPRPFHPCLKCSNPISLDLFWRFCVLQSSRRGGGGADGAFGALCKLSSGVVRRTELKGYLSFGTDEGAARVVWSRTSGNAGPGASGRGECRSWSDCC